MKIHEYCRHHRRVMKYTQGDLAKMVGVRQATISDFETGKRSLGSDTLDRILMVLNVDLDQI